MIGKYIKSKNFDYENGFYLTSAPFRIGNMLSHYELYKKICNLPGDIIELGVFKGGSLIQFATYRELLENENSRKIIGFDVFGKFPGAERIDSDRKFVEKWNQNFCDDFLSQEDLYKCFEHKKMGNIQLVKGKIEDTIDEYLCEYPSTRIALLHIDLDIYESTKYGLERLFDRVVKGGLVVFDDFSDIEGATIAIEEFLNNKQYRLQKLQISHTKPSYIVK